MVKWLKGRELQELSVVNNNPFTAKYTQFYLNVAR